MSEEINKGIPAWAMHEGKRVRVLHQHSKDQFAVLHRQYGQHVVHRNRLTFLPDTPKPKPAAKQMKLPFEKAYDSSMTQSRYGNGSAVGHSFELVEKAKNKRRKPKSAMNPQQRIMNEWAREESRLNSPKLVNEAPQATTPKPARVAKPKPAQIATSMGRNRYLIPVGVGALIGATGYAGYRYHKGRVNKSVLGLAPKTPRVLLRSPGSIDQEVARYKKAREIELYKPKSSQVATRPSKELAERPEVVARRIRVASNSQRVVSAGSGGKGIVPTGRSAAASSSKAPKAKKGKLVAGRSYAPEGAAVLGAGIIGGRQVSKAVDANGNWVPDESKLPAVAGVTGVGLAAMGAKNLSAARNAPVTIPAQAKQAKRNVKTIGGKLTSSQTELAGLKARATANSVSRNPLKRLNTMKKPLKRAETEVQRQAAAFTGAKAVARNKKAATKTIDATQRALKTRGLSGLALGGATIGAAGMAGRKRSDY
ncbi:hypothetical protein UFOVP1264_31 [uncultured Caudovirales phage]|uniref:Uncharacterized protein n=1 Tax=uncultured Caudovirales phage TaxID=2100421 RepID=A0A6J5RJR5_9CAUD|nr:hypothetical protein UFOVP1264_31 [uncultured Caudovirales phage]